MKNAIQINDILSTIKHFLPEDTHADCICDYSGSTYICDAISEIADSNTSIYYSDILDFIKRNPEALADVVAEGLYEVRAGQEYDLYKHGQAAEYMTIEHELYDHLPEMLQIYAADYIRENYGPEVDGDTWENIVSALDSIDNNNRLDDVEEIINAAMTEAESREAV